MRRDIYLTREQNWRKSKHIFLKNDEIQNRIGTRSSVIRMQQVIGMKYGNVSPADPDELDT